MGPLCARSLFMANSRHGTDLVAARCRNYRCRGGACALTVWTALALDVAVKRAWIWLLQLFESPTNRRWFFLPACGRGGRRSGCPRGTHVGPRRLSAYLRLFQRNPRGKRTFAVEMPASLPLSRAHAGIAGYLWATVPLLGAFFLGWNGLPNVRWPPRAGWKKSRGRFLMVRRVARLWHST